MSHHIGILKINFYFKEFATNIRGKIMKCILVCTVVLFFLQVATSANDLESVYNTLAENLVGDWQSPAWSGQLSESWGVGEDGWLHQQAYYFEESDTTYRAKSKIEQVGNELILFSVIENSNPKIFKATIMGMDSVVFENSDYRNPYKVVYHLIDEDNFHRTITGMENDSLVSYTFKFKRLK